MLNLKANKHYFNMLPLFILLALLGTGQALYQISVTINGEIYGTSQGEIKKATPENWGLTYENVTFPTEEDLMLKGWYIDNKETTRTIVLTPGKGINKWDILEEGPVDSLFQNGFDILLFDPRSSGQSDGTKYGFGYYESQDIINAAEFLLTDKGASTIGVWGCSAGASAAIMSGLGSDKIDAIVADSPYASLQMAASSYRHYEEDAGLQVLFPLYMGIARLALDFDLGAETNLIARVPNLTTPLFLIHGLADKALDPLNSQMLYEKTGGPRRLWLAEGAWHVGTFEVYPEEYIKRVTCFFNNYMPKETSGTIVE